MHGFSMPKISGLVLPAECSQTAGAGKNLGVLLPVRASREQLGVVQWQATGFALHAESPTFDPFLSRYWIPGKRCNKRPFSKETLPVRAILKEPVWCTD